MSSVDWLILFGMAWIVVVAYTLLLIRGGSNRDMPPVRRPANWWQDDDER